VRTCVSLKVFECTVLVYAAYHCVRVLYALRAHLHATLLRRLSTMAYGVALGVALGVAASVGYVRIIRQTQLRVE